MRHIIRHRICRAIYYWDSCPTEYEKDYKAFIIQAIGKATLTIIIVVVLLAAMLIF